VLRSQSPNEVDEVSDDKCLQHDHHAASFQEFTFRNLLKKLNSKELADLEDFSLIPLEMILKTPQKREKDQNTFKGVHSI